MRIDWIPWQEKSIRKIYPIYRKIDLNTKGTVRVFENENREFTLYHNETKVLVNVNEEKIVYFYNRLLTD